MAADISSIPMLDTIIQALRAEYEMALAPYEVIYFLRTIEDVRWDLLKARKLRVSTYRYFPEDDLADIDEKIRLVESKLGQLEALVEHSWLDPKHVGRVKASTRLIYLLKSRRMITCRATLDDAHQSLRIAIEGIERAKLDRGAYQIRQMEKIERAESNQIIDTEIKDCGSRDDSFENVPPPAYPVATAVTANPVLERRHEDVRLKGFRQRVMSQPKAQASPPSDILVDWMTRDPDLPWESNRPLINTPKGKAPEKHRTSPLFNPAQFDIPNRPTETTVEKFYQKLLAVSVVALKRDGCDTCLTEDAVSSTQRSLGLLYLWSQGLDLKTVGDAIAEDRGLRETVVDLLAKIAYIFTSDVFRRELDDDDVWIAEFVAEHRGEHDYDSTDSDSTMSSDEGHRTSSFDDDGDADAVHTRHRRLLRNLSEHVTSLMSLLPTLQHVCRRRGLSAIGDNQSKTKGLDAATIPGLD